MSLFQLPFNLVSQQVDTLNQLPRFQYQPGLYITRFDQFNGRMILEPHGLRMYIIDGSIYAALNVNLPISCGGTASRYEHYNPIDGQVAIECLVPESLLSHTIDQSIPEAELYVPIDVLLQFKYQVLQSPGLKLSPVDCFNYVNLMDIFDIPDTHIVLRKGRKRQRRERDHSIASIVELPQLNTDEEWYIKRRRFI